MKKIVAFVLICIVVFATVGCVKDGDIRAIEGKIVADTQDDDCEKDSDWEKDFEVMFTTPEINTSEYKVSKIKMSPQNIQNFKKSEKTSAVLCEMFGMPCHIFNVDYFFESSHYDFNVVGSIYADNYFDEFGKLENDSTYSADEMAYFNKIVKKYFPNVDIVFWEKYGDYYYHYDVNGMSETDVKLYDLLDTYFRNCKYDIYDILENHPQLKTVVKFSITNDYKDDYYANYVGYNENTNVVEDVHEFILHEDVYNTYFAELDKEING